MTRGTHRVMVRRLDGSSQIVPQGALLPEADADRLNPLVKWAKAYQPGPVWQVADSQPMETRVSMGAPTGTNQAGLEKSSTGSRKVVA